MAKISPLFFWTSSVKEIAWEPFWWLILFLVILFVPFLRVWWWFFLPVMLVSQLRTLYLWWINWDFAYANLKWQVLEIIPPREILAPLKVMEDVFNMVWPIWDGPNWRERWCEGELGNSPFWCSWEIVSIEGRVHFYLRLLTQHRLSIETALYAHYPDIGITEVSDYVKSVPQTAPNEEWDAYGEDFYLVREPAYPIKVYEKFFEPKGESISAEEKRMDPIISLLEGLSKLGPGEQYWVQFITIPITDKDFPWMNDAQKIIDKISKKATKKEITLIDDLIYIAKQVIFGPEKEGSGDKASYKWAEQGKGESGEREMILTPGERELITDIENKMKKSIFKVAIRGFYIGKRENWKSSHKALARSYLQHFSLQNANRFTFSGETRPKVHYIMRKRRQFIRARRMFRNAVLRFTPMFPDRDKYCAILSSEELATIFHFPLRISGMLGPTMSNIESKKSGPPSNLPIG